MQESGLSHPCLTPVSPLSRPCLTPVSPRSHPCWRGCLRGCTPLCRMVHGKVMHLLALRLLTAAPRHRNKQTRNRTRNCSGSYLGRNGIGMCSTKQRRPARAIAMVNFNIFPNYFFPAVEQKQRNRSTNRGKDAREDIYKKSAMVRRIMSFRFVKMCEWLSGLWV